MARREIAGILEVLGKLHRGQTLHRITLLNEQQFWRLTARR